MPKVSPEELWKRKVLERVRRFMQSPDLIRLRKIGQTILDRDTLVGPEEWWDRAGGLMNTPEYRAFEVCCEEVGHEYGLAQWTVEGASLMRDYDPTEQDHVLEAEWPSIHVVTVVTDVTEDLFLRWLIYEAGRMGLYVQQQTGSTVTPVIAVPMEEPRNGPLIRSVDLQGLRPSRWWWTCRLEFPHRRQRDSQPKRHG